MKIKNLIIGEEKGSNITVLFLQGGPSNKTFSSEDFVRKDLTPGGRAYHDLIHFAKKVTFRKYNFIQIKQVQNLLTLVPIKWRSTKKLIKKNLEIINEVVKYYKNKGHKVVLFGHSYGSYMIQEYISKYNTKDLVDLAILGNSRFRSPQVIADNIKIKLFSWFNFNGKFKEVERFKDSINLKLLHARLLKNDYTKCINPKTMPKTLLVTAAGDKWLGNLVQEEIDFFKKASNMQVVYHAKWYIILGWLFYPKSVPPGAVSHHSVFSVFLIPRLRKIIDNL